MTTKVTSADLAQVFGKSPKLLNAFRELFVDTAATADTVDGAVAATGALQSATALTISSNAALQNERIFTPDPADFLITDGGPGNLYTMNLISVARTNGGYRCTLNLMADTDLDLPTSGQVVALDGGPYADDAAAAAGGVPVNYAYRKTGGTVAWRVS